MHLIRPHQMEHIESKMYQFYLYFQHNFLIFGWKIVSMMLIEKNCFLKCLVAFSYICRLPLKQCFWCLWYSLLSDLGGWEQSICHSPWSSSTGYSCYLHTLLFHQAERLPLTVKFFQFYWLHCTIILDVNYRPCSLENIQTNFNTFYTDFPTLK